ncbi:hypothetical protein NVP1074O_58 [Vibrio phage 1.074.O._10N.222.49.B7]|nr:hypothetical protein NVP1074O_58 [Vibrio phage 1.074.O._10N.222.49.B7]
MILIELNELAKADPIEKKQAFIEACSTQGYLPPMDITQPELVDLYLKVTEWTSNMILICGQFAQ